MSPKIEELAKKIADLDPTMQENLLEKVAEINFERGFSKLTEKYKKRLINEQKLEEGSEEILAKLREIRAEVAANDYSAQVK